MAATSTQTLITNVKAYLEANLPAVVATASLPVIAAFLSYPPARLVPASSPQLWLDVESDTRSADPGRGASLGRGGWYSHFSTLLVGVTVGAPDELTVNDRLRGYADCVRNVLEDAQYANSTPRVLWVLWQRTDYSPVFNEANGLFREVVLAFDVNRRTALGTD